MKKYFLLLMSLLVFLTSSYAREYPIINYTVDEGCLGSTFHANVAVGAQPYLLVIKLYYSNGQTYYEKTWNLLRITQGAGQAIHLTEAYPDDCVYFFNGYDVISYTPIYDLNVLNLKGLSEKAGEKTTGDYPIENYVIEYESSSISTGYFNLQNTGYRVLITLDLFFSDGVGLYTKHLLPAYVSPGDILTYYEGFDSNHQNYHLVGYDVVSYYVVYD